MVVSSATTARPSRERLPDLVGERQSGVAHDPAIRSSEGVAAEALRGGSLLLDGDRRRRQPGGNRREERASVGKPVDDAGGEGIAGAVDASHLGGERRERTDFAVLRDGQRLARVGDDGVRRAPAAERMGKVRGRRRVLAGRQIEEDRGFPPVGEEQRQPAEERHEAKGFCRGDGNRHDRVPGGPGLIDEEGEGRRRQVGVDDPKVRGGRCPGRRGQHRRDHLVADAHVGNADDQVAGIVERRLIDGGRTGRRDDRSPRYRRPPRRRRG